MTKLHSELLLDRLAELWQLDGQQRAVLAALGEEAIPALQDIQQTLERLFPHNPQLAELWPTTANRALDNRSPLQVFAEEGIAGVEQVRRFLCLHH